jgi:protein-tyrosine phosphatase
MSEAARSAKRRLRRAVKEIMWRARGVVIRNPSLPADVRSILFVCKGNICRSPFAAVLARRLLDNGGRAAISAVSAGLKPSSDGACPLAAVRAAEAYGVATALRTHRPVELTTELIRAYDLVVVMEAGQLAELRRRWPEWQSQFVLLSLYEPGGPPSAYERFNITDPFGRDDREFDRVYRRIDASLRGLLAALRLVSSRSPAGMSSHES